MQRFYDAASNVASSAATSVTQAVKYVAGVEWRTAESYLNTYLNQTWSSEDNPLEPAGIDPEYRFVDGQGKEKTLLAVMKTASAKNRSQRGLIISLVQGDSHERFFFKTLTSITYGEGFVGENGKDLSFETQDFLSFGMIVLRGGRVVLHEQRNEQRKDEVKE